MYTVVCAMMIVQKISRNSVFTTINYNIQAYRFFVFFQKETCMNFFKSNIHHGHAQDQMIMSTSKSHLIFLHKIMPNHAKLSTGMSFCFFCFFLLCAYVNVIVLYCTCLCIGMLSLVLFVYVCFENAHSYEVYVTKWHIKTETKKKTITLVLAQRHKIINMHFTYITNSQKRN